MKKKICDKKSANQISLEARMTKIRESISLLNKRLEFLSISIQKIESENKLRLRKFLLHYQNAPGGPRNAPFPEGGTSGTPPGTPPSPVREGHGVDCSRNASFKKSSLVPVKSHGSIPPKSFLLGRDRAHQPKLN